MHLLSALDPVEYETEVMNGMCRVARLMLEYGADTTKKDSDGNNCLHRAILSNNIRVFRELLKATNLLIDDRNNNDHVPLWLALEKAEKMSMLIPSDRNEDSSFAFVLSL